MINNIIEIIDNIKNVNILYIFPNIIKINKKKGNEKLKIRFTKDYLGVFLIGFSINLKELNINYEKKNIKISKISKIELKIKKNDIIEIQANKYNPTNPTYTIYLNFLDPNKFLHDKLITNNYIKLYNLKNEKYPKIKKIIILLSIYIKSIGYFYKLMFEKKNIKCEIKYTIDIKECFKSYNNLDTVYLILLSDIINNLLPMRVIFYQIEQSESKFLTKLKYLQKFKYIGKKAEIIWEYSKLSSYIYSDYLKKIEWKPMPFIYNKYNDNNYCEYDIFFYGTQNARRKKILSKLSKLFNINIGFGCYDSEKILNILKSKIILNLHYYKNAGLETCRINEILNYNKIIISEKSENDNENMELYENIVIFTDEIDDNKINDDESNLNLMIEKIKYYLDEKNYLNKINQNRNKIKKLEKNILNSYNDFF